MHQCASEKEALVRFCQREALGTKINCCQQKIVFHGYRDLVNLQIRGGEKPCGYEPMLHKKISFSFPNFALIFYPYILKKNPKMNPPLTYKIEEKPSNQQKQTTKQNKKLGTIMRKEK